MFSFSFFSVLQNSCNTAKQFPSRINKAVSTSKTTNHAFSLSLVLVPLALGVATVKHVLHIDLAHFTQSRGLNVGINVDRSKNVFVFTFIKESNSQH